MSPRPRTIDDGAILEATATVISRLGPSTFTLADVAQVVRLSPATLLQRFGSKRGLMLALARSGVDGIDSCFRAVRAAHPRPLDALTAAATEMTRHVDTPEEMANHLAFLQIDLRDPEFYQLMLEHSARILAGYKAFLDEAVAAGDLVRCDTRRLARAVGAMAGGSLISWAVVRDGTAEAFVRKDLETLLAAYRTKTARKARGSTRKPGDRKKRP
jgi:AcrR family transcriptional regulator